jgi:hypothetical protein
MPRAGVRLLPECAALAAVRLSHDWSWAKLSAAMDQADAYIAPRTLHYLLTQMPATAHPHDRTLHKIRRFLKAPQARLKPSRRAS